MISMDCRKVIDLMPDYSVELLDRRTRADIAGHLAGCARCRAEMAALEHAVALVEQYAAVSPPAGLWNGVVNRLTAEALPPSPARWAWLLQRPARAFAVGLAGLAVLGGLTFFPRPRAESPSGPFLHYDGEASALMRQHALTQAEAPLSERAVWEIEAGPATAPTDQQEDDSRL